MPDPSIFTQVINSYLPEPQASLLNGIIFGVDVKTTKDFYYQLKVVGLLHIVVLSGMNITMLGAIVGKVVGRFGKNVSVSITSVVIVLFILFVGPQAPIVRAGVMGILTLISIVYGRKFIALYTLFASVLIIGIFWPDWLTTVSFQLSFGATLGIILFGGTVGSQVSSLSGYVKQGILKELRPSLAAQVFTVPIIFIYFKQISTVAPLSNILVAWFIPPLMILGFTAAFLGKIHFLLGLIPAWLCYGILTYLVWLVETVSELPFIYFSF